MTLSYSVPKIFTDVNYGHSATRSALPARQEPSSTDVQGQCNVRAMVTFPAPDHVIAPWWVLISH